MLKYILIGTMIVSGILFIIAVMFMTPKGGLGIGLAGTAGSNEYGSKKSIETTLKKIAIVTSIIFFMTIFVIPYLH